MWFLDLDDNCWACKNKNGCGSCGRIKQGLRERKIKSKRDKRMLEKETN